MSRYIGISTPTFDIRGNLLFKADIAATELKNMQRRVTRSATLDGGVSIIDSGFAHGDRTFSITARLTEAECDRLEYLVQNYSEVILAVPEGIFSANLKACQNFHGSVRLEVLINEKLAPIVAPPYYCAYDETFHDIDHWYVTKKHGGETATIVTSGLDKECRLDLPDSLDTEIKLLYQYLIPAGDFDIMLDVGNYTPDNTTKGFHLAFRLRSSNDDYRVEVRTNADDSVPPDLYEITREFKELAVYTTDVQKSQYPLATIRIIRVGNEISLSYFDNTWQTVYTKDLGVNAGEVDRIEMLAYDNTTRGGQVDVDNLVFRAGCPGNYPKAWTTTTSSTTTTTSSTMSSTSTHSSTSTLSTTSSTSSITTTTSTYWCEYNETFENLDHWQITTSGQSIEETATIVANKLHLDVPSNNNVYVNVRYQYIVPSGDFTIDVDMSDYITDGNEYAGQFVHFRIVDDGYRDWVGIRYHFGDPEYLGQDYSVHVINSYLEADNSTQTDLVTSISIPTKFRIVREGTTLKTYYYLNGWNLIGTRAFGTRSNNPYKVELRISDNSGEGGEVKFDNLRFRDGCPDAYPKVWTTSTTTTTTTTTTSSSLSTSSTLSTSSSTSSSSSTLSSTSTQSTLSTTTSSSSSTSSMSSTSSTTTSSSSSTSSTASTLSTTTSSSSSTSSTASTLSTTTSSNSTTSSCSSTLSTASTSSSTSSTASTLSTTSSCSTTTTMLTTTSSSTSSTASTTSSSSSTASTLSTISTTTSSSSTASTLSTTSTSSSSSSTVSTLSTTTTTSSSSSTSSTVSTLSTTSSTISTSSSSSSTFSTLSTTSTSISSTTTTTYWCEYNETFNDLDLWEITKKDGGESATIVGGELHIDLPDTTDTKLELFYQYQISGGDFDIQIDTSDYTPDSTADGFRVHLRITSDGSTTTAADYAGLYCRIQNATPQYNVSASWSVDSVLGSEADIINNLPTKFRVVRDGNDIKMYYYDGGWVLAKMVDFGARAANLTDMLIFATDDDLRGGSVDLDNLIFVEGCPDGYPKAWTTTSTTTTTCTTTSTAPPP